MQICVNLDFKIRFTSCKLCNLTIYMLMWQFNSANIYWTSSKTLCWVFWKHYPHHLGSMQLEGEIGRRKSILVPYIISILTVYIQLDSIWANKHFIGIISLHITYILHVIPIISNNMSKSSGIKVGKQHLAFWSA